MGNALAKILPITVRCGDVVSYPDMTYSVVYMNEYTDEIILFEKSSTKLYGLRYATSALIDDIYKGDAIVSPGIDAIIPNPNNEIYQLRLAVIKAIKDVYGPTYMDLVGKKAKTDLLEIQKRFNVGKTFIWNTIRIWLQGGCRESALYPSVNKNRTLDPNRQYLRRGRKNKEPWLQSNIDVKEPEIEEIFQEYANRVLEKHFLSIQAAYTDMIIKYFSKCTYETIGEEKEVQCEPIDYHDIPTLKQFRHWFLKHTSKKQRDIARTSVLEYKNNQRLLYGDTFTGAHGPGYICEADHWEIPVKVVSEFSNDCVSKPTLTVIIDTYSGLPISVNLSFDNNSDRAYTSVMFVLGESKKELCARYNVQLADEKLWPSGFYPSIIRVDSGPDFKSKNTQRVCKENGIELQLVTPGIGSYKPNVERFFNTLKLYLESLLEGKGYVSRRHDCKADEEALLTITELGKIIYDFILMYIRSPRLKFKPTKDMILNNVHTSPLGLFEYGCKKYGAPRPITDMKQYNYSLLMVDEEAFIKNNGIHSNGLVYMDRKNKELCRVMEETGEKGKPFPVRFDPRNTSYIYFLEDDFLVAVPLKNIKSQQSLKDLSLYELERIKESKNKQIRLAKAEKLAFTMTTRLRAKGVIHTAEVQRPYKPGTKNIKENRRYEQEAQAKASTIADALNQGLQDNDSSPASLPGDAPTQSTTSVIKAAPAPTQKHDYSDDEMIKAYHDARQRIEQDKE